MGEQGGSSFLPAHNSDYLEAKYWDERFQKVHPLTPCFTSVPRQSA